MDFSTIQTVAGPDGLPAFFIAEDWDTYPVTYVLHSIDPPSDTNPKSFRYKYHCRRFCGWVFAHTSAEVTHSNGTRNPKTKSKNICPLLEQSIPCVEPGTGYIPVGNTFRKFEQTVVREKGTLVRKRLVLDCRNACGKSWDTTKIKNPLTGEWMHVARGQCSAATIEQQAKVKRKRDEDEENAMVKKLKTEVGAFPYVFKHIVLRNAIDNGGREIYWTGEQTEEAQDFFAYWRTNGINEFLKTCIAARNRLYLDWVATFDAHAPRYGSDCDGQPCPGPRTGDEPTVCPFGAYRTMDYCLLGYCSMKDEKGHVTLSTQCIFCHQDCWAANDQKIRGKAMAKNDPAGNTLCIRSGCPRLLAATRSDYCKEHLELVRKQLQDRRNNPTAKAIAMREVKMMTKRLDFTIFSLSEMMTHLQTIDLELDAEMIKFQGLHRAGKLYYIDTEFSGPLTTQIAVVNTSGKTVVQGVIDYGLSIEEMQSIVADEGGEINGYRQRALDRFYKGDHGLPQITPQAVARKLEELNVQYLVEWSVAYCDIDHLSNLLSYTKSQYICPRRGQSALRGYLMLRNALKLKGSTPMGLECFFNLMFPDVHAEHHLANVDAWKLWKVMKWFFEEFM